MKIIGALALAAGLAIPAAVASDMMPAAQQNELVAKFCASCHDDAKMIGGLTLQRFDAAHVDPSLAAMLASKLKDGALGASGLKPLPDRATQDALLSALAAEGGGAGAWTVERAREPKTQAPILIASMVRQVPTANPEKPDLYRLKLTCHVDTHEGEMQVAWAPADVPGTGGTMSAAVDGQAPLVYKVANGEGNAKLPLPWPGQTLTIGKLFGDETVVFPFTELTQTARQALSACFGGTR